MKRPTSFPVYYNQSAFSAIFLNNDKVYFGHIVSETADTLVLNDVYYLKANAIKEASRSAKLSLLKLGDQLYENPLIPQDIILLVNLLDPVIITQ